jgi:hypothetical protein
MRIVRLLILYLIFCSTLQAQTEGSIEQYHYIGSSDANAIVPVVHLQTKKGWYGEARYNYDEKNTFSVLGGKTFSGEHRLDWSLTPMVGIAFGDLNGFTAGLNVSAQRRNFFFNLQSQYTVSTTRNYNNFLFSWGELGYQPLNWLYGGISLQHTREQGEKQLIEPGALLGITFNKVSFPFYVFNTFSNNRFFVLGVNWEWKR